MADVRRTFRSEAQVCVAHGALIVIIQRMSQTATFDIPQDILDSARLSLSEARLELAIALYAQRRLSIGKARELANVSLWQFRQILAARRISVNYDVEELHQDIATLQKLKRS